MDKAMETSVTIGKASVFTRLRKHFTKAEDAPLSTEKRILLRELDDTLYTLRCARLNFQQATSPEIVEACIYEIKSAESRYCHLLRRAKQLQLERQIIPKR